jgi:hypothetical protein
MLESKKAFEVTDDSAFIVGSRRSDSSRASGKTNGQFGSDLGQPFLWRAAPDQSVAQKPGVIGQWPLGTDLIKPESKIK